VGTKGHGGARQAAALPSVDPKLTLIQPRRRADNRRMAVAANPRLLSALDGTARALIEALEADGCAISRVVGDVLLLVTEQVPPGRTAQVGAGYLLSEYPLTQYVLERREPQTLCVGDPDCDPAEERVLVHLGFQSLLMLPLELGGGVWGLVELYREEPVPFDRDEIRAAVDMLGELAQR